MREIISLEKRLRSPIVDGLFYPEEKAGVLAYMKGIGLERGKGGLARAIVAPHGAWEISGSLAGAAFASAGGRAGRKIPSRVVIMGPVHDNRERGLFLSNSHSFQTPLGELSVDRQSVERLASHSPLFEEDDIPHLHEHSIEVLLPFVKYCFPDAAIVPILMGGPGKRYVPALASALGAVFGQEMDGTLLVVSFNLTAHWVEDEAAGMAGECVRLFREGRLGELRMALQNGAIASCGGTLFAALLQSGLVDAARPCLASDSLLSAKGEKDKTVYYSAFSFV
ncbi:MAG: AmmeMemoRadiSam system protein B [Treponema sp.]|nr:AmmeMemoRadiSam system protein B [Treponema sp.]